MKKKLLFIALLGGAVFLPFIASATQSLPELMDGVKTVAISIGIAIVVIGWVIAGILYLTAAGAPEKVKTAKGAMIAAIIGTVLIILAQSGYESLKGILGNVFKGQ